VLAEIKQLLELQGIDERIADVEARLARLKREQGRHVGQIEEERKTCKAVEQALSQMEHDSRMLNLGVDELDMQIREYQKRLDKGIISFKEMEDLRAKIEIERSRMSTQEDDALTLMDSIEAQRGAVLEAKALLQSREAELRGQIEECKSQEAQAQSDLEELESKRQATADSLPLHLRTQYETLRSEMAHPIAEVRGGVCGGCKLRVSGNTAARARGEMGVVTCEHCSRILYAV